MSDLIDRQAAIDALTEYGNGRTVYIGVEEAIRRIEQLPPAQPVDKDINVSCKDAIDRQAALDTEGLDEQIRCEMCRNPMHTDRGCDGNCKYDEKLYERIMQILGERIKPLPSVQSDIIHCKDCKHKGTKNCVANVWTNVWGAILGATVKDDFYCGLAERRTDDER